MSAVARSATVRLRVLPTLLSNLFSGKHLLGVVLRALVVVALLVLVVDLEEEQALLALPLVLLVV